ncbi:hypothetical protein RFI_28356 [Reticulomyxa filosa]|uniref:Uncharacterized protein n=1 Tax=Reticulomyxa filosa TaxID=46433 RepID=X6M5W4_RETFI|nr:hypothetical protein RFI_28356 [Reticulomyxa filosa]|eukprot:ETO09031.1 hypothetical protein RFI_28356 [Reticulomyxa filosa]
MSLEGERITTTLCVKLLLEFYDCCMAWQSEFKVRLHMTKEIGHFFNLDPTSVERLLTQRTPERKVLCAAQSTVDSSQAKKGSVNINANVNANASEHEFEKELKRQSWTNFILTQHALCLMEQIAMCVVNIEPVLLIDETGNCTTASVQYLAQRMNQKLIIQNLSQSTDSSDFLGGTLSWLNPYKHATDEIKRNFDSKNCAAMIDRTKIMIERMINRFVSTSLLSSIDSNTNENINKNINENIKKIQRQINNHLIYKAKKIRHNNRQKRKRSTLNTRPKPTTTTTESETLKREWQ